MIRLRCLNRISCLRTRLISYLGGEVQGDLLGSDTDSVFFEDSHVFFHWQKPIMVLIRLTECCNTTEGLTEWCIPSQCLPFTRSSSFRLSIPFWTIREWAALHGGNHQNPLIATKSDHLNGILTALLWWVYWLGDLLILLFFRAKQFAYTDW